MNGKYIKLQVKKIFLAMVIGHLYQQTRPHHDVKEER